MTRYRQPDLLGDPVRVIEWYEWTWLGPFFLLLVIGGAIAVVFETIVAVNENPNRHWWHGGAEAPRPFRKERVD